MSAHEEVYEFHLVHAIITQTQNIDGNEEPKKQFSEDEDESCNKDQGEDVKPIIPSVVLQDVCQKYSNIASKDNKMRVVPTYMKNLMQRKRSPCKSPKDSRRNSSNEKSSEEISNSSSDESDINKYNYSPPDSSSNVQQKVLHFEQCAFQQTPFENAIPANQPNMRNHQPSTSGISHQDPSPSNDPSSPSNMENRHIHPAASPGDVIMENDDHDIVLLLEIDNRVPGSSQNNNRRSSPSPPPSPPIQIVQVPPLTGRNLKRVPSERFQEMRRKVQRLMAHQRSSEEKCGRDEEEEFVEEEKIFLDKIRMNLKIEHQQDPCPILNLPDHALCHIFQMLDTRTLASLKMCCSDFTYVINCYDVRGTDSMWTKDHRYEDDPCKLCRRHFVAGDQSLCMYHPKRYYSDSPYGRSYWMCCLKADKTAVGCQVGLHDNNWLARPSDETSNT